MYEGQPETFASKVFFFTLPIPSLILDCSDNPCDLSVSLNDFVGILCCWLSRAATAFCIIQVGILSCIYSKKFCSVSGCSSIDSAVSKHL